MKESALVATHLNEFDTILNPSSSIEIDFNDEVRAPILLASLLNSWKLMKATISNFVCSAKLTFNDIRDRILAEEVHRIDLGEASTSSSTLNLKSKRRRNDKSSKRNKSRLKSRNERSNSRSGRNMECWNCGKIGHIKSTIEHRKIRNKTKVMLQMQSLRRYMMC